MLKYLFPLFFIFNSCDDSSSAKPPIPQIEIEKSQFRDTSTSENEVVESAFTHLITFEEGTGYGYQIFENDHLLINQAHIPAVAGVKGFSTEEKAEITALYILKQVQEGNFPPTITKDKL